MRTITSFRDPAGTITVGMDRVVRRVRREALPVLERLLELPAWKSLVADGMVIDSARVARTTDSLDSGNDAEFLHPRVPFLAYPFEWPRRMLAAAGELTLDIAMRLNEEGRTLKDATPFNVAFIGSRPVFLDVLSVEEQAPDVMEWKAFGQFIRTFLLPLLYARDFGVRPATSLLHHRDGLAPEAIYPLYSSVERISARRWSLVTLPTLFGRFERVTRAARAPRAHGRASAEKGAFVRSYHFRRLRAHLAALTSASAASVWTGYDTHTHTPSYRTHKHEAVSRFLAIAGGRAVLDIGCNEGVLSVIAARGGARVVAIDSDEAVLDVLYRTAIREKLDILPLFVDLANPTPALGWDNHETFSFLERAEGQFDVVLAVSVIHHLLITHGIPLSAILHTIHALTTSHAIVELVLPHDAMFQELAWGREAVHSGLNRATFISALEGRFSVVASERLRESERELFLLRRQW